MNNMKQKILSLLVLLMTAATGAWAADTYTITFSGFGNETCNKTVTDATLEYSETFNFTDVDAIYANFIDLGGSNEYVSISKKDDTQITITVKSAFEGTVNVTVNYVNGDGDESARNISVTCVKSAPAIEVTTNAPSAQDLFTEASFEMPTFDATVNYDIVRDLAQQTSVNLIIGTGDAATPVTADTRLRIQKVNNVYAPVSALSCTFTDAIENKTILPTGFDDAKLTPLFYKQGENDAWTLVTDINTTTKLPNNLQPGQVYCITLKAADGSYYDGETPQSFTVTLFEGYEVAVPAGEYVTFYRDEPLYADPVSSADAKLYTTTDGTATLSSAIATAPSNTPLLVYNAGNTDATFLLIPADAEPNLALTVAPEFIGTTEATTIAASTSTKNNYALNGKQFVWVKNAISIGANKAYLSVTTGGQLHAPALSIVSSDATGVNGVIGVKEVNDGSWYDLNGRKLQGMPTKKGIYINNGRKVVVK